MYNDLNKFQQKITDNQLYFTEKNEYLKPKKEKSE